MSEQEIINSMLKQQQRDNEKFLNMPIERIDDVVELIVPPEEFAISPTRFFVDDEGVVILKRFIDRKLYCVRFTNGLMIENVNQWLDCKDSDFKLIGMIEIEVNKLS